jgi:Inorganic pyrophosphatase
MSNFFNLPPFTEDGDVHVVVETPRGSRAKFAYDPKLESFSLSKSLLTGLTYPHDWGFVPSTKADDDDPLDIMLIHDAATFPGLVSRHSNPHNARRTTNVYVPAVSSLGGLRTPALGASVVHWAGIRKPFTQAVAP